MAEEASRPKRRYTRRTTTSTTSTRRKRTSGSEIVDNLNSMIGDLIKENRKLKRQVEKLSSKATSASAGAVEKGLRSIQRKLARATTGTTTTRRRRTTSTSSAANGRRRRSTSTSTSSSSS